MLLPAQLNCHNNIIMSIIMIGRYNPTSVLWSVQFFIKKDTFLTNGNKTAPGDYTISVAVAHIKNKESEELSAELDGNMRVKPGDRTDWS